MIQWMCIGPTRVECAKSIWTLTKFDIEGFFIYESNLKKGFWERGRGVGDLKLLFEEMWAFWLEMCLRVQLHAHIYYLAILIAKMY